MKNNFKFELEVLRKKIDIVDLQIHDALLKRHEIVEQIAYLKKKYDVTEMSTSRKTELLNNLVLKNKLPKKFIYEVYDVILKHSIKVQKFIFKKDETS